MKMFWKTKGETKIPIAIGYARISTNDHLQKHSLDAQSTDIRKYAELYGYKLKKIELEQASGKNLEKREKLKKLLSDKNFDVIITPKIDRLARNIVDLNLIVSELQAHGKDVVFIENNLDTSTANGRLFLNIIGSFAEFEAKVIGERVKRGMQEAKEKGIHVGRPRSKKMREEDEVKQIRILRQRQQLSYSEIAKKLGYSSGSVVRNKVVRFREKKKIR